jgi:hypothetical protein
MRPSSVLLRGEEQLTSSFALRDANVIICLVITALSGLVCIAAHVREKLPLRATLFIVTGSVLLVSLILGLASQVVLSSFIPSDYRKYLQDRPVRAETPS